MGLFSRYDNDDNTKIIIKDGSVTTKETEYDDGAMRFLQIRDYDEEKHDTWYGIYDPDTGKYIEGYHGENSADDDKKTLGDITGEMLKSY